MPNWCANYAVFKNENEALLQRLVQAYNSGDTMSNFLPCPEELCNTVAGSPQGDEARAENDRKKAQNLAQFGHEDWYGWNVANWGTKWDFGFDATRDRDAAKAKIKTKNNVKVVELGFDTAWEPPLPFYAHLHNNFGFDITAYFFEPGMGFCGTSRNGSAEVVEIREFTPEWVKNNISEPLRKIFNLDEEAEYMQEMNAEEEDEHKSNNNSL